MSTSSLAEENDRMKKLMVDEPVSGGIFLTYKCTGSCKHCMYACSPGWGSDWIDLEDVIEVMTDLTGRLCRIPGPCLSNTGINYGLHLTGGEPFLNFDLLLELTKAAKELNIPGTFVETNCFWCTDHQRCRDRLTELRDAGLDGILISVNPFTLEHVPLERVLVAIRESRNVFGRNVLIYQWSFLEKLKRTGLGGTLPLERSLELMGPGMFQSLELLTKGRAPYDLGYLYRRFPAEMFFASSCGAELRRGWHFHIDNYFNYIPSYCGGISLGDARDLDVICEGVDLDDRPILDALAKGLGELFRFAVEEFNYVERTEGYVSKCHLCVDIRKHIVERTSQFKELSPREFYLRI